MVVGEVVGGDGEGVKVVWLVQPKGGKIVVGGDVVVGEGVGVDVVLVGVGHHSGRQWLQ